MRFWIAMLAVATTIVAGCRNNDDGNCVVTTASFANAPSSINQGASVQLTPTIVATSCSNLQLVWTSSNDTIATVDQHGMIHALVPGGPVTVSVLAGDKTASASFTVITVPVAAVGISPDSVLVALGSTLQLNGRVLAADSTLLLGRDLSWSSSTVSIASVGPNGVVSGNGRGSAIITATSASKSGSAKVFVVQPRLTYFWNEVSDVGPLMTPDSNYSFSLTGGVSTAMSPLPGSYIVRYGNFTSAGVETQAVFTTPNGGVDGGFCLLGGWNSDSASVRCYDRTGLPSQSSFDLVAIGSATLSGRMAYAVADQLSSTVPYAPSAASRYSSSGLAITMTRTATGVYSVLFAGLGRTLITDRESIIVSNFGPGSAVCQLSDWTTAVTADLTATVRCFTPSGVPADGQYVIGVFSQPRPGALLVFADANQPTTAAYTPVNSTAPTAGLTTVSRFSTGQYSVRFDGFVRTGISAESFLVSGAGPSPVRCQLAQGGWTVDVAGVTVGVSCTDVAGNPVDTRFVIVGVQ